MDKKILDSFNNLSLALQNLADNLEKNSKDRSNDSNSIVESIKGLDINQQIRSIQSGIEKIKTDQKQVITTQKKLLETITNMSSKKESVNKVVKTTTDVKESKDNSEKGVSNIVDPKNQRNIKDGIKIIVLMAAGVLAMGAAFKIIGDVDWKSVIALSISMPLIAYSFERISKINVDPKQLITTMLNLSIFSIGIVASSKILSYVTPLNTAVLLTTAALTLTFIGISTHISKLSDNVKNIDVKNMWKLPIVLIATSVAISASSYILQYVVPISNSKLITTLLISAAFAALSLSIHKLSEGIKNIDVKNLWKLPIVLLSTSIAISLSSYALQYVKPVSIPQLFTTILIAASFTVLSYGISKMAQGFKNLDGTTITKFAISMPLILIALSASIAASSQFLSSVVPISFSQALTSIAIGAVFVVLSYGLPMLADSISKVGIAKAAMMPLVLISLSLAIVGSSIILQNVVEIGPSTLLNIALQAITLTVLGLSLGLTMMLISKMGLGIGSVLEGSLILVAIAGSVMLSSLLLNMGTYDSYPSLDWSMGTSLTLLVFSGIATVLGMVALSGVGAIAILAGAAAILVIAASISATSYILSSGNYSGGPSIGWSMATSLLLLTYGMGILAIGTLIVGTLGLGYLGLKAGAEAVNVISQSIVDSSFILSKGKYVGGPSKDWAEGIGLAISAFSPVYSSLSLLPFELFMGNKSLSMANAIRTISQGIVDAAMFFNGNQVAFNDGYPSSSWSTGVGNAIGAFAPVFDILNRRGGGILDMFIGSGPSLSDLKNAITGICESIVTAANFFNSSNVTFTGNYPTTQWAEGVGGAISAFAPVFDMINKRSGGLWGLIAGNGPDIEDIQNAIIGIASSISGASLELNKGNFSKSIPDGYMDDLNSNIKSYMSLINFLKGKTNIGNIFDTLVGNRVTEITRMADDYTKLSKSIEKLSASINNIDLEKIQALKLLSGSVVLMSLMDSSQFEDMMDALEDKAKIFSNVINDLETSTDGSSSFFVKSSSSSKSNESQQIISVLNSIDSKLSTISANSSAISSYINHLKAQGSGSQGKLKPNK